MPTSELDDRVTIDAEGGAISLITRRSGKAGHSMVAIEYLHDQVVENVVAHLVALPKKQMADKPNQAQLILGWQGGNWLKTRILIQKEGTIKDKIGDKVKTEWRTWRVANSGLARAMTAIGLKANLTDTRTPDNPHTESVDWSNSPDFYNFLGKFTILDPGFGINCANWAVSILEEAGVTNVGGRVVDIPSRLTQGGLPRAKL